MKTTASVTQDTETSADPNERCIVSRKELAREKRHSAYQSAKERRATDPHYLAMKEAAKVQRRVVYQKIKNRRKAVAADEKAKQKAERNVQCTGRRVGAARGPMEFITWECKGSIAQND